MGKVFPLPRYRKVIGTDNRDGCGGKVVEAAWGRGWRLLCLKCRKWFERIKTQ